MYKKGQAALEFLTTYGWAFLVILVMIGALAYFGVLNPENFVSDSCSLGGAHFRCDEASLTTGTLTLRIINSQTDQIQITSIAVTDPRDSLTDTTLAAAITGGTGTTTADIPSTTTNNIVTTVDALTGLAVDDKVRVDVEISYTRGPNGLPQKIVGSVTATVQ